MGKWCPTGNCDCEHFELMMDGEFFCHDIGCVVLSFQECSGTPRRPVESKAEDGEGLGYLAEIGNAYERGRIDGIAEGVRRCVEAVEKANGYKWTDITSTWAGQIIMLKSTVLAAIRAVKEG